MALLEESGDALTPAQRAATEAANARYFQEHLDSPLSRSWVVELDGKVVAVGTLAFFTRPPYPGNLEGKEAYLLNMYTRPSHRKSGAASTILKAALNHAQLHGHKKVWLHATEAGKSLYTRIGFTQTQTYMQLVLP